MSNQFKTKIQEIQEENEELHSPFIKQTQQKDEPTNYFFKQLFEKGIFTKEAATNALPFIVFLTFLGIIYIGNRHGAENNIREIDKLSKEVKELSWDFKTLKADLMFKSKQTEVIAKVDSLLGLKVPLTPAIKLEIDTNEY